jgi:hypothetical protein
MTGFFLVRRECLDGIQFQPSGFKLLLAILARGCWPGSMPADSRSLPPRKAADRFHRSRLL